MKPYKFKVGQEVKASFKNLSFDAIIIARFHLTDFNMPQYELSILGAELEEPFEVSIDDEIAFFQSVSLGECYLKPL